MKPGGRRLFIRLAGYECMHLMLGDRGVWVPGSAKEGAPGVPGLGSMLLGSSLARGGEEEDLSGEKDLREVASGCEDPRELETRLKRNATLVAYSSIVRCFLARPRGIRRAKLAFDFFDHRSSKVKSMEFRVDPESYDELEEELRRVIPDRLEIH